MIGQQVFKIVLGHARLLAWRGQGPLRRLGPGLTSSSGRCASSSVALQDLGQLSGGKLPARLHGHNAPGADRLLPVGTAAGTVLAQGHAGAHRPLPEPRPPTQTRPLQGRL